MINYVDNSKVLNCCEYECLIFVSYFLMFAVFAGLYASSCTLTILISYVIQCLTWSIIAFSPTWIVSTIFIAESAQQGTVLSILILCINGGYESIPHSCLPWTEHLRVLQISCSSFPTNDRILYFSLLFAETLLLKHDCTWDFNALIPNSRSSSIHFSNLRLL